MWSVILLLSLLPEGHSMSAGRRPEKLGYGSASPDRQSAGMGTARRLVPTERRDRRLDRSMTRVKGPRNPGASP